jgi:hypothetical protein
MLSLFDNPSFPICLDFGGNPSALLQSDERGINQPDGRSGYSNLIVNDHETNVQDQVRTTPGLEGFLYRSK